jgi:tetratricopeptide (TPR) repeat protein
MAESVLKCGGCGKALTTDQLVNGEICPLCDEPARIKRYQTVVAMPLPKINKYIATFQAQITENPNDNSLKSSLGLCFLKMKLQEKALPLFEKAMIDNFTDPDPYFFGAVCLLKGKKAFLALRPDIETIEKYLEAALGLEPKAIFYYFQAYIKNDYYERKHMSSKQRFQELYEQAKQAGITEDEISEFYTLLGAERPSGL